MITVLTGGTDAASMLIFDPASLPEDFDIRVQTESSETLDPIFKTGAIYRLNTGKNGSFRVALILGDRVPTEVVGVARKLESVDRFDVSSGRLYFTGIEYAFRHDNTRLRKCPEMGSSCEIPPGVYRLTVYERDDFEGFNEVQTRNHDTAPRSRTASWIDKTVPLGCLGMVPLIVGLAFLLLSLWLIGLLILTCGLGLIAFLASRSPAYRERNALKPLIALEKSEYWATLQIETQPLFS